MTMQDLLKACALGEMPRVKLTDAMGARFGTVQGIKTQTAGRFDGNNGCSVLFDGEKNEKWFINSDGNNARSLYMRDLELIIEAEIIAKQQHQLIMKIIKKGLKSEDVKCDLNVYTDRLVYDPLFIKIVT
jgi:hypothetical protein